ncbi:OmcA/MtrC family decaheme c-type cytochrome [Shewanella avicenniae]|uniref:OmcA/MtrC family decaheme c-type cytochrome n=1 Tax=Shewanella avicenniae TaxID=2814294 RepID=A0ABX7QVC9_9GAMM|nr:OmcA/MtrC family decaheme c-type cytochrome [Shewanella avicenniae]QSX34886.1 OmcA/MtrC family decaheme c-type cytochrome [Shewanella avicenniae]
MMNALKSKYARWFATSALSLALAGCGGSDGTDGADGNAGNPGGAPAMTIDSMNVTFYEESITDGVASVRFLVTNQDDEAIVGLQQIRFYALQLAPKGALGVGDASAWQYLVDETCTVSGSCPGTFEDKKNGVYTYTFATKLTDTAATRATFNPELAQRFMLRLYSSPLPDGTAVPNTNALVDFTTDGNTPSYSRKIVATESCNNCHGDVSTAQHHGGYNDVNFCASCHTLGRVSEGKQFSMLIHDVHFNTTDAGEIEPAFESDALKSCNSCHTNAGDATPDWNNWAQVPTAQACGSCHNDIDFATGVGHTVQQDNSSCVACHTAEWTEEVHSEAITHKRAVIDTRGMQVSVTGHDDNTATISINLLDGEGNVLDLAAELPKIKRLETITNVGPNFPVMGYLPSPGTGAAHLSQDFVSNNVLQDGITIDGNTLSFVTPALPFGAGDTDTAFTFVGLEMCSAADQVVNCAADSATTSMKAALAFGTKSGAAPSHRHTDSVNYGACQQCHGDTFSLHKGYHAGFVMSEQLARNNVVGLDGCVACHTPDGTYSGGAMRGAFEMKLHVVHNEVGVITECTQCHSSFNLDAFDKKGALATSAGAYTTPVTAVCTSCHTLGSEGLHSQQTLESYGAVVNGDYNAANQAAQSETCFYCHKPTAADHTQVNM